MHATPYFKHANIFGYSKYIGPPPFLKPGSAPAHHIIYLQSHSLSIARTLDKADIRTIQALNHKLRKDEHIVRNDLGNTRATSFTRKP